MTLQRYSKYLPIFFIAADLISFNLAFAIANYQKFGAVFNINNNYTTNQVILNLIWILIFFSANLHKINREFKILDYLNKALTGLVINLSVVFAIWFVVEPSHSRQHLFFTYLTFSILIIGWRFIWYFTVRYFRARGYNFKKIIVVGHSHATVDLISYFHSNPGYGYKFLGFFDNSKGNSMNALGEVREVEKFCIDNQVGVIFCYLPSLEEREIKRLIDFAENNLIRIKILSKFSQLGTNNLAIQRYGAIPILNVNSIPMDNLMNKVIKRSFDIIFSSLVILFIFSWLVPILAVLIKIESRGPLFFKQHRNGLGNKQFKCLKFRTMIVNDLADIQQATKYDPRITKIGSILRKTSIDELPQFINVFLGDMSVVGPRPHRPKLNNEYREKIDRFNQRHAVKPGITGLAQAKGYRGETSQLSAMSGRVKLDRFYVKNWSLILDFKIIILTILSILRGNENAY